MIFNLLCKFCGKECGTVTLSESQIDILKSQDKLNIEGAMEIHSVHDVRCDDCIITHGKHGRDCDESCKK